MIYYQLIQLFSLCVLFADFTIPAR